MNLLLDTAAFLWFAAGDDRLPARTRSAVRDPGNDVWLSTVSVWEVVVKHQLGRLDLPGDAWSYTTTQRDRHGIDALAIDESALAHLAKLPAVHRDPFDRVLICQAIEHDLVLVTSDALIRRYPVKTFWPTA